MIIISSSSHLKLNNCVQIKVLDQLAGGGCKSHWLHFCNGVRPHLHQRVSWYDIQQSDSKALILKLVGKQDAIFNAITPSSTLARSGSTGLGPIYGSTRLFDL